LPRFSDEEIRRYSRQILLREVGGAGQERLLRARPRLCAAGVAGEVAAEYLRRAGVRGLEIAGPGGGGLSLVALEEGAPLWAACDDLLGEVGCGCACACAIAARSGAPELEFAVGSLLALETLKRLLGVSPLASQEVLRLDLAVPELLSRRTAAPCGCP
jgi:hypothetical protein